MSRETENRSKFSPFSQKKKHCVVSFMFCAFTLQRFFFFFSFFFNFFFICAYQDYEKGGLRMVDFETMIKALRLAWISGLLQERQANWKTVPVHFFSKLGGLNFLLTCSYDVTWILRKLTAFLQRHIIFLLHPKVPLWGWNVQKGFDFVQ